MRHSIDWRSESNRHSLLVQDLSHVNMKIAEDFVILEQCEQCDHSKHPELVNHSLEGPSQLQSRISQTGRAAVSRGGQISQKTASK